MRKTLSIFLLGAALTFSLNGCGGGTTSSGAAETKAAVSAAAQEMTSTDGHDNENENQRVSYFKSVFNALRADPVLAPLFSLFKVPRPVEYEEEDDGLVALLGAVKITVSSGTVTITNRATGGVIFSAPLDNLAAGVFYPENMPGGSTTPPPPSTCTYIYSAWGACQPDGTQTRTVVSAAPAGCTGTPVTSQSCTYVPPVVTCTGFTYSVWGACQPNNTQTRSLTSSMPAGCTGGNPVLSQSCVYTPPVTTCTSFTYSAWGACQPNNTQTRTVTSSSPAGCTGGSPVLSQSCTYVPPACTYTYSAWSTCSSSGTQTRTVVSSSPAGCAGTPVLSQSCTPPLDGAALYTTYCAGCHGPLASSNLKGLNISVSLIKSFNMTRGLSDAQLQAIVTAIGP